MTLDEAKLDLKKIYEAAITLQAQISDIDIKVSQAGDAQHINNALLSIIAQNQYFFPKDNPVQP